MGSPKLPLTPRTPDWGQVERRRRILELFGPFPKTPERYRPDALAEETRAPTPQTPAYMEADVLDLDTFPLPSPPQSPSPRLPIPEPPLSAAPVAHPTCKISIPLQRLRPDGEPPWRRYRLVLKSPKEPVRVTIPGVPVGDALGNHRGGGSRGEKKEGCVTTPRH